ncbi:MAG: Holliday junction branch migration DNA helicase RuvB [Defluviitaleaceae bacterium]|nr:Holliday junction branch migration DNA helicase RuvB [Defluviitaleaceae bacterium]MCL2240242.1 Holliday junction branch migration DNA helicase RuvB [Defluviitaleaceae bacterium]
MTGPLNTTGYNREEDEDIELKLRPTRFDEYIGQDKVKENMQVFVEAALQRGETLDHVLLYGQPGLGKTTLSGIIASAMNARLRITAGPAIERPGDMAAILNDLNEGDFLFIDEIHRLPRNIEEILYPAMEDFVLDIIIGKGPAARSIRLDLPRFTLVGATTRIGLLTAPLRDRFGVVHHLEPYSVAHLCTIITRSATVLGVEIQEAGAEEIARRARGTPRIANRLLKRVRDFAQVRYDGIVTHAVAKDSLDRLDIDPRGLDAVDKKILCAIIEKFGGGPVGLDTLAASIDEEAGTLEDVAEPYLLQLGFIQRTPRGRIVTQLGYQHLGIVPPVAQGQLLLNEV